MLIEGLYAVVLVHPHTPGIARDRQRKIEAKLAGPDLQKADAHATPHGFSNIGSQHGTDSSGRSNGPIERKRRQVMFTLPLLREEPPRNHPSYGLFFKGTPKTGSFPTPGLASRNACSVRAVCLAGSWRPVPRKNQAWNYPLQCYD